MSHADQLFVTMCKDIIENGYSSQGQKVRSVWEDGTPAHTMKRFGIVNRYDLSKEFPALTLHPTAIKSAVDKVLWIWQKKSNNIKDLNITQPALFLNVINLTAVKHSRVR